MPALWVLVCWRSSCVCGGGFVWLHAAGILGKSTASTLIASKGSFKDYCRGVKEAINLCLPNGIRLSFKASEIFWKMISFCLLIFPCGHIVTSRLESAMIATKKNQKNKIATTNVPNVIRHYWWIFFSFFIYFLMTGKWVWRRGAISQNRMFDQK